jgi:hypothetical protein
MSEYYGLVRGFLLAHDVPQEILHALTLMRPDRITSPAEEGTEQKSEPEKEIEDDVAIDAPTFLKKLRKPRKPLSEETKAKLAKQLILARAARAARKSEQESKSNRTPAPYVPPTPPEKKRATKN